MGIDKVITNQSIIAFPNCNRSMAFHTFCGVIQVDSGGREPCGSGRGGCPEIPYRRTFAYLCHTWGEVTGVVGFLSLNIFHALLLSCPRNKWYKWSSNLAKYNLFLFLTSVGRLHSLVCVYKCPELHHVASISLYHNIPHRTNYFVLLYQVWGEKEHESKKAMLTSFKMRKWPIRPNKRLHLTLVSRLWKQQTKINTAKHRVQK